MPAHRAVLESENSSKADNARKNTAFPPVCKKCAKVCRAPEKGKSHEESYDSSWDFGALEGTRIPGPLIKRIKGASFVKFQKFEETLFLSYHRKTRLCTYRIVCIQCNALQPLSSYSGVQKVCKNVQTGKTKPNGKSTTGFMAGFRTSEQTPFDIEMRFTMNKLLSCRY